MVWSSALAMGRVGRRQSALSMARRQFSGASMHASGAPGDGVVRVNLWSSPRCASTSLMYAFAQRRDTTVVDEPLYAHYLTTIHPSAFRPYRDLVLKAQNNDGNAVVKDMILAAAQPGQVLFFKHMAKHLPMLDHGFLAKTRNVILCRHPAEVLASWSATLGDAQTSVKDIGLEEQISLLDMLRAVGQEPIVVVNETLIQRPEGTLRALCDALGIEFQREMLKWPKGGRKEDGLWAPYWYHNTHASTGFSAAARSSSAKPILKEPLKSEVAKVLPSFHKLQQLGLRPTPILPDARNHNIWVHVGGVMVPRSQAKVSVFDSSVQGGDAVWEGLRVYSGKIFALEEHVERLVNSARALMFERIPSTDEIKEAIFETLHRNDMFDECHIRLTLTRGEKVTSGMSPSNNQSGPCLIVLAEWKPLMDSAGKKVGTMTPQRLITSSIRRNTPSCLDSKIHHNNLLNNILAKIQANHAGVDDALMLDLNGFVSETNACNFFIVRKGRLITPHADACLPGITRRFVIEIARELAIPVEERNVSLAEVYSACEAFTTGTMGALVPVSEIDGRGMTEPVGIVTQRLQDGYLQRATSLGVPIPRNRN